MQKQCFSHESTKNIRFVGATSADSTGIDALTWPSRVFMPTDPLLEPAVPAASRSVHISIQDAWQSPYAAPHWCLRRSHSLLGPLWLVHDNGRGRTGTTERPYEELHRIRATFLKKQRGMVARSGLLFKLGALSLCPGCSVLRSCDDPPHHGIQRWMKTWETESRSHTLLKKRADPHVPQRAQDGGQTTDQAITYRPRDALIARCIGTVLTLILVLKARQCFDGAGDGVNIQGMTKVAKRSEKGQPFLFAQ